MRLSNPVFYELNRKEENVFFLESGLTDRVIKLHETM